MSAKDTQPDPDTTADIAVRLAALDNLTLPTVILSRQGRICYANQSACRLLLPAGQSDSPQQHTDTLCPDLLTRHLSAVQQLRFTSACQSSISAQFDLKLPRNALRLHLSPLSADCPSEAPAADTPWLQATLEDISTYQAEQHLPAHFQQAMQQTEDMVMVTDCHGRIEYVNPAFSRQTGYSAEEVLGSNPRLLSSDQHDNRFYQRMWQQLHSGQSFREVFVNRRRCGETYHEEKTITPVRNARGQISHFVATGRDITSLINSEQNLNYLRRFDSLTRLPNRQRLSEQFELHLKQRRKTPLAMVLIDLDHLSRINDSLGRAAGDELLQNTADRLRKALPSDFVGRLGSDAFVVMAEGIRTPDQAAQLAQKIHQIMSLPFALSGNETYITASLGIALYPYDDDQFDELVSKADSAMHRSKNSDQSFCFFTEDLTRQTQQRVQLENRLRQALLRKEFHLVFQPRVNLATGRIDCAEALLRWQQEDGRTVSPADFIPVLEEMGLITSVGEWVLMRACQIAGQWQKQGRPLQVSVNLSARQLRQPNLQGIIRRCLDLSGLSPRYLELELTETSMLEDVEHSINQLQLLREQGIRIAIDDFGTGYSSLAYLKRLPADTLKIDRAFVQGLEHRDQTDRSIVQSIIQLAHNLKLQVTAEGIETPCQLQILQELGCNEAQGFLLARPMPEADLVKQVQQFRLQDHLSHPRRVL